MNKVWSLAKKDLNELKKEKQLCFTFVLIPLILCVILPILLIATIRDSHIASYIGGMDNFIEHIGKLPIPKVNLNDDSRLVYGILFFFFLPLFSLVPIIISTGTSTTAIVGEKEARTLEGLLSSPLTIREIFLGKIISAILPALIINYVFFAIYSVIVNAYTYSISSRLLFPNTTWMIFEFIIIPLITFLTVMLTIAVANHTASVKSAQSVSVVLVLPVIGGIISQSVGLIVIDLSVVLLIAIVLVIVDLLAFILMVRTFNIEKMLLNN